MLARSSGSTKLESDSLNRAKAGCEARFAAKYIKKLAIGHGNKLRQ